jgi:SOS-response transcriptional repressor LexA
MSEGGCTGKEPFALQVLGTSMEPEFAEGVVVIVDPAYPARNGAYVVIEYDNEISLRQYVEHENRKYLRPLNELYPTVEITGTYNIIGVVVQQSRRGKRREVIHYS